MLRWLPLQYLDKRGRMIRGAPEGSIVTVVEKDKYEPKSPEKRFNGKLVVLINGHTFSAASLFAEQIKKYKLGIIAGLEGSQRVGGDFAEPMLINLPNTKLPVNIATAYFGHRN